MKNIKHLEEKDDNQKKFMNWLNEPNSQPLSLKQFGSCYTYLKAPQNDDFLYYSAGSIRPRPTGNGETCKPQSKKAEIRKNRTRQMFQQICPYRTAGLREMWHCLPQSCIK